MGTKTTKAYIGRLTVLKTVFLFIISAAFLLGNPSWAAVDKVYHPYVQPSEREIEFRSVYTDDTQKQLLTKLALGYGLTDRVALEAYIIADKLSGESFDIKGYEVEALIQLSEQGEYSFDWGLLLELERESDINVWEFGVGLLLEKEFGEWVSAANLIAIYEAKDDADNEPELEGAFQLRYRYSPRFEPAFEIYVGEYARAAGPVILGDLKLDRKKKVSWELGVLLPLNDATANTIMRGMIEYEF